MLSFDHVPNYRAGITFFVAVAATNLFHQGNWQRVYAAKNNNILVKSLLISFFVIIPIVFFMGFCGLVAISVDPNVVPDLGFFSLLFKDQTEFLSLIIIILGLSLTISTVDTLVNAVSSLVVVDGKATFNIKSKVDAGLSSEEYGFGFSHLWKVTSGNRPTPDSGTTYTFDIWSKQPKAGAGGTTFHTGTMMVWEIEE